MCVIISAPAGAILTKDLLTRESGVNPDGWGLMWPENGKLMVKKGLDMEVGVEEAFKLPTDVNRLIHFRIATNGAIAPENCHPFQFGKGLGLMHNGIIPKFSHDKDISDTKLFASHLGAWLAKKRVGLSDSALVDFIKKIDSSSRFALMNEAGEFTLVGDWVNEGEFKLSNGSGRYRSYTGGYSWSSMSDDRDDDWRSWYQSPAQTVSRVVTLETLKLEDFTSVNASKLTALATGDFQLFSEKLSALLVERVRSEFEC